MTDTIASISAELGLNAQGFLKEIDKAHNAAKKFESGVQKEFDRINGTKAAQQVELIGKAVERMGGLSALTSKQVDILRQRVEALVKAGAKLPSALAGLGKVPVGSGVGSILAGNIQTQGLSQLQSQLGPLGGLLTGISGGALAAAAGIGAVAVAAGAAASAVTSFLSDSVADAIAFESAFAGVRKTVEATPEEFEALSDEIRNLSTELPITATALAGITEAAGQLGIKNEDLIEFTETMAKLGITTNLSADEAATALARFNNIVSDGKGNFDRLGSTIVELGNKFASTEKEIVDMGLRIAGAGEVLGLSQGEILAFATALSSVGIEAEAGGTAISKVMIDIAQAVSEGGAQLDLFAKVAGQSSEAFKTAFKADAAGSIRDFIAGLGDIKNSGGDVLAVLKALGIEEVRMRDALLRSSAASDQITKALEVQAKAWQENSALNEESAERVKTTAAQWQLLQNELTDVGIEIGNILLPAVQEAIAAFREWMPAISEAVKELAALGPILKGGTAEGFQIVGDTARGTAEVFGILATAARDISVTLGSAVKGLIGDFSGWNEVLKVTVDVLIFQLLERLGRGLGVLHQFGAALREAAAVQFDPGAAVGAALAAKTTTQGADLNKALLSAMPPKTGGGFGLPPGGDDKAAKAAEQLAKRTIELARDIDKAFTEASKGGLTDLEQGFIGVDLKVAELSNKLADLVAKGLDPSAAAAFGQEIGLIGEKMRTAVVETQRMSVIGQTFADVDVQARNFLQTMAEWGKMGGDLTKLTDAGLQGLESRLSEMVKVGAQMPTVSLDTTTVNEELRSLEERLGAVTADSETITMGVDTSALGAALDEVRQVVVDGAEMPLGIDASALNAALENLQDQLRGAGGEVPVGVDTAEIDAARSAIEQFRTLIGSQMPAVRIDTAAVETGLQSLETHLQEITTASALIPMGLDTSALGTALSEVQAVVAAGMEMPLGVDASALDAALSSLRGQLQAAATEVPVGVDTTEIAAAIAALEGLQAIASAGLDVTVGMDSTAVAEAAKELENVRDRMAELGLLTKAQESQWNTTFEGMKQAAANSAQAILDFGESFQEVNDRADEFLKVFYDIYFAAKGLSDQTDTGLREMAEDLASVAAVSPDAARGLAAINEELERRAKLQGKEFKPIVTPEAAANAAQLVGKLHEIGAALMQIGAEAGGAFGQIVTGIGMATQALAEFKETGDKTAFAVNAFGAVANAITGTGAGKGMDSASGAMRALAGAAKGAKLGMQIGSLAGPMGAVVGAAAGAVVGGIVGALKKPSWVKAGEEAGKILGTEVSMELAKAIEATSKELDISIGTASLLHISDAMEESGKAAGEFFGPVQSLMQGIAAGTVPAVEGMEQLEEVFGAVRDQAQGVGDAMTVAMLTAAKATGTLTDGMKAFISEQNQLMAGGAAKIATAMENIAKVGGPIGERAAMFFAVGFQAAIEEQGLLGAVDSLGAQAIKLFDQLSKGGNKAAASMIGPFAALAKKLGGDSPASKAMRGQLELLEGMGDVFEGAANQGLLTADLTAAFGSQLTDSFNALVKGGIDAKTAMSAIKPELDNAVSAAAELGVPLDANTQALKDQAIAMGFAFPTEPIVQLVDLMKTLVEGMGFALPASAQAAGAAITTSITGASTAAGSAFSSSMGTISSSAAGAAASASSSLSGIGQAAEASSSTLISAFTGVGAEITGSITEGTDDIAAQLTAAFGLGMDEASQLAAMIQALGNQSITIPVIFDQQGGFAIPGGDTGFQDIPKFQHGSDGFKNFGAGTQAILHHVEGVFTPTQIKEMLREAATAGASMRIGEQHGPDSKLMEQSFKFQDEIHRARIQSDATAAITKERLRRMYADQQEALALLHGQKAVVPEAELNAMKAGAVGGGNTTISVTVVAQPHHNERQIADETIRRVRLNTRGSLSQAKLGHR